MDDALTNIDNRIKTLLSSDKGTREISRASEIPLSTVSKIRNGHIELDNVSYHNIKRLYNACDSLNKS